MIRVLI